MFQRSVAEVQEHRGHRPELGDGGEGGPGILPTEEGGHDPQVPGARDRQELREPLDDAENDGLEGVHGGGTVAIAGVDFRQTTAVRPGPKG